MGIVITIATFAVLGFIGWLIYRAVRGRQVKAHHITYGIAVITGIFTYGFFLSMNILQPVKIVIRMLCGLDLVLAADAAVAARRSFTIIGGLVPVGDVERTLVAVQLTDASRAVGKIV